MRNAIICLALLAMVASAGCASKDDAPERTEPIPEPEQPTVAPNTTAAPVVDEPAPITWLGNECAEVHGTFLFASDEYRDQVPPGYQLDTLGGQAIVRTLSLACTEGTMHYVALLVIPPDERLWLGATHGMLLEEVWISGAGLAELHTGAGISHEERSISITRLGVLAGLGMMVTSQEEYFMDVQANPTAQSSVPERFRMFGAAWNDAAQRVEITEATALDIVRSPSASWNGPAVVHSHAISSGALLPFNQVGSGDVPFENLPISFSVANV